MSEAPDQVQHALELERQKRDEEARPLFKQLWSGRRDLFRRWRPGQRVVLRDGDDLLLPLFTDEDCAQIWRGSFAEKTQRELLIQEVDARIFFVPDFLSLHGILLNPSGPPVPRLLPRRICSALVEPT